MIKVLGGQVPRQKPSDEDYQNLGRTLEKVLIKEHVEIIRNWRRVALRNLLRGLFFGLGSVVGATLMIALLLWLLSLLGEIPFIGELFEKARETIQGL